MVNLREANSLSQELYRRCMDADTIQYGNLSSENKIIEINKMKERMNDTWGKLRVVESKLQPNINQSFLTK